MGSMLSDFYYYYKLITIFDVIIVVRRAIHLGALGLSTTIYTLPVTRVHGPLTRTSHCVAGTFLSSELIGPVFNPDFFFRRRTFGLTAWTSGFTYATGACYRRAFYELRLIWGGAKVLPALDKAPLTSSCHFVAFLMFIKIPVIYLVGLIFDIKTISTIYHLVAVVGVRRRGWGRGWGREKTPTSCCPTPRV